MMGGEQDCSPTRFEPDILDHEGGGRGIKPFRCFIEDVDIGDATSRRAMPNRRRSSPERPVPPSPS
jgi:hypothetical protein